MIRAKFLFGDNSQVIGFSVSGHSGYSESGSDIICASISSACYMVANTVTEILKLDANIEVDEETGLMSLELKQSDAEKAKDILAGLKLHIEELAKMYPNFIKIERGAK